jgi:hypothetical protein
MGTNSESVDLGEILRRAVSAARQGDVPRLEVQLATLRRLDVDGIASISVKLRGIACAARSHPSFRIEPAAAAG